MLIIKAWSFIALLVEEFELRAAVRIRVTPYELDAAEELVIIGYSKERGATAAKRREAALYENNVIVERVKYNLITV